MLIILEGIDGSGKSTLLNTLKKYFNDDINYAFFFEPTKKGRWGKKIQNYFKSKSNITQINNKELMQLYRKDRYWNIKNNIRPALKKNKIIFLDRYYFSTAAYQASSTQDIQKIIQSYVDDPLILQPNAVFYLNIEPSVAFLRICTRKKGLEIFEQKQALKLIHNNYTQLIDNYFFNFPIFNLDASKSPQLIFKKFLHHYQELIDAK